MPEQFGPLFQSAYEAGYRQGFRDGYTEARTDVSGSSGFSTGARTNAEENSGPRLLGLPYTNCGCFFHGGPVAVSALQDSQSKKNGGAVAQLQFRKGGAASHSLEPSST